MKTLSGPSSPSERAKLLQVGRPSPSIGSRFVPSSGRGRGGRRGGAGSAAAAEAGGTTGVFEALADLHQAACAVLSVPARPFPAARLEFHGLVPIAANRHLPWAISGSRREKIARYSQTS